MSDESLRHANPYESNRRPERKKERKREREREREQQRNRLSLQRRMENVKDGYNKGQLAVNNDGFSSTWFMTALSTPILT